MTALSYDYERVQNEAWLDAHENSETCPYCHNAVYQGNWRKHMAIKHSTIADPMTYDETRSLATHEAVITAGLDMFYAVGKALATIHEQRLYRATHGSFKAYCAERWNMSRQRGYQLMKAAGVVDNLSCQPMVDTDAPQINERQARAIASLAPHEQRVVYELAVQTAPNGKPTASSLKSLVVVAEEVSRTHAIDDGTGEQIEVSEIFKHRVLEESYERAKRQEIYLDEKRKAKEARLAAQSSDKPYTPPAPVVADEPTAPTYLFEMPRTSTGFSLILRAGEFASELEIELLQNMLQAAITRFEEKTQKKAKAS